MKRYSRCRFELRPWVLFAALMVVGCIGGEAPLPPHEALAKASAEVDLILARERDAGPAALEPAATPNDPRHVSFWYYSHPLLSKAFPPGDTRDFERAHPGITLDAQFIGDWSVAVQKLTVSLAAGDMPDIAVVKRSWLARLIPSGRLAPLESLLPLSFLEDLKEPARLSYTVNGHLYALPADGFCSVLYYDTETVLPVPQTWEQLRTAAQRFAKTEDGPRALGYWPFLECLWSAGGEAVVNDASGLGSPEAQEALDFILSLRDDGALRPDIYLDEGTGMEAFLGGRVAMTVASSAHALRLAGARFRAGTAPVPGKNGPISMLSDDAIVVFRRYSDAKADALVKVLDYLTGDAVQGASAVAMGSMPVRRSVAVETPEGIAQAYAVARNTALVPAWSEVEHTLQRYLRLAFLWRKE